MKALVQSVNFAELKINGNRYSKIDKGFLVLLGIEKGDTQDDLEYTINKVLKLRVIEDENGKMNLSLQEINGQIMIVSQFTLCADCSKGNRPSFLNAELPEKAECLYKQAIEKIKQTGISVVTGVFGAYMQITLENNGPVTIMIESKK